METPQSATAQDLFGVGVRLAALYLIVQAFESLLDAVYVRAAWSPSTFASVEGQLLYAFGYSALGFVALVNAGSIVKFAYRTTTSAED